MPTPPVIQNLVFSYASELGAAQNAALFGGGGGIILGTASFPTTAATIEFWIATTQTTADAVIMSYDDQAAGQPKRLWIKTPSNLQVGFSGNATTQSGISVADGSWHHVAVVVAPTTQVTLGVWIYVDGALSWSAAGAITRSAEAWPDASADLQLGAGLSGEPGFNGELSEFRIWNQALTATQIVNTLDKRLTTATSGVVLDWSLTQTPPSATATGVTYPLGSPPISFVTSEELTAGWNDAGAGYSYNATVTGGVDWIAPVTGLTTNSVSITGFDLDTYYTIAVAAVSGGTAGTAATQNVATVNLNRPTPTASSPTVGTVLATWDSVDLASEYSVILTPVDTGTQVSSTTSNTSSDISNAAFDAGAWTYTVAAGASAVSGPASLVTTGTTSPTATLAYVQDADPPGTMVATLTATDKTQPYLLAVAETGAGTQTASPVLTAGVTTYTVGMFTPNSSSPQQFTATARAMPSGAIGPLSSASTITVLDIPGPMISSVTADASTTSVTVTFQGAPGNTSFIAQLCNSSAQLLDQANPATSPQVLTSSGVVDGASLEVRIRAFQSGSYGRWSAWSTIVVGAPAQVQGVSAQSDVNDNISVGWTGLGSGITYLVKLYNSQNTCIYTATPNVDGTSTTMLQSQTGVSAAQTYTVTVAGISSTGMTGAASAPATVTTPAKSKPTTTGDPVNVIAGQYTYSSDDIALAGVVPLVFTSRYSGAWQTHAENPIIPASPMGNRWTHSYMTQIVQNNGYDYVLWADGQTEIFQIPASYSGTQIPAGVLPGSSLLIEPSGAFTLTRADKTTYTFFANGVLNTVSDHFGNVVQLAYNGTQLSTITDVATGLGLTVHYNNGYINTVTDPLNRTVTYSQNGSGDLVGMTDPCNNTRSFTYQGASLMQYAVDGNGNKVFQNTYTNGVITSQQGANALKSGSSAAMSFAYQTTTQSEATVVVTSGSDAAGNSYSYTSSPSHGVCLGNMLSLSSGQVYVQNNAYDGNNNLIGCTVYLGPTAGHVAGTGNVTTYQYDGNGNCTQEITALSSTNVYAISRTYDQNSNLLTQSYYEGPLASWRFGLGNTWTFTYYDDNALHTSVNPLGGTVTLTYDANALPQTMTDEMGNVTTYSYTNANLISVVNALGETITITPDAIGRPHISTYQGLTGGILATVTTTYNNNNQLHTRTVQYPNQTSGYLTTLNYDGNGNLLNSTDPAGNTTNYGYTASNNLQSVTFAPVAGVSRMVVHAYDNLDNPLSSTLTSSASQALSLVTSYVCDAQGRLLSMTDPMNFIYTYSNQMEPGSAGPFPTLATTVWPLLTGETLTYSQSTTYDPLGRPIATCDRNGGTITFAYTTQTDSITHTTLSVVTATYPATSTQAATTKSVVTDAMGRPVSFTNQLGQVFQCTYGVARGTNNSKVLTVTITDPNGDANVLTYDAAGRLVGNQTGSTQTNRSQTFTYDCLGRILSQATTQGTISTQTSYAYGFDTTSNCWTVSVGRPGATSGLTVQYYDGLNQLVKQAAPFGATTSLTYTPWGAFASYTDGRGQTLTYEFDDAGRLKQTIPSSGAPIVYTLDNNGNRQSITMGTQSVAYTWDNWNRKLSRTGVEGAMIGYAYWPEDQLKTLTYSDGKTVTYAIDTLGRLITVTDWDAKTVTYAYTLDNQLATIAYPNGASSAYGYDPGGRQAQILHKTNGLVIAQWTPIYDPIGQIATATVINPLVPSMPTTATSIIYADSNQINQINGSAAAYDADGNYLGVSAQSPLVAYDIFGRVTSASLSGFSSATYTYDPDGLRTQAVVGSVTSNYVFDVNGFQSPMVERADPVRALAFSTTVPTLFSVQSPYPTYTGYGEMPINDAVDRILEVRDQSQTIQTRYVYGLGLIGQQNASGTGRYFHPDVSGNMWALTDMISGLVTDAAVFAPFGQTYAQSDSMSFPFRYSGLYGAIDDGTGLVYMRARSYSPVQMRFVQPDYVLGDPLRPQTFNQYSFALGNPVQWTDPLGLDSWSTGKKIGVAAASIVGLGGLIWTVGAIAGGGCGVSSVSSGLSSLWSSATNWLRSGGRGGNNGGQGNGGGNNAGSGNWVQMRTVTSAEARGELRLTSAGRARYTQLSQSSPRISVSSESPDQFESNSLLNDHED